MIVFDLECRANGHRFEGWFGSSDDFERQRDTNLLVCPICGSAEIDKAVMAPRVARKGNQLPEPAVRTTGAPTGRAPTAPPAEILTNQGAELPPEAVALLRTMAAAQAEALKSSRWVGGDFAEQARAIHYGERAEEVIHGQASPDEARALLEEGVAVAPLLFPVIPPEQAN